MTEETKSDNPIEDELTNEAGASVAAENHPDDESGSDSAAATGKLADVLLDRMTGKLGTESEIIARGHLFQAAVVPALQEAIFAVTGLDIDVRSAGIRTGRRRQLWSDLAPDAAYCTAEIRGWSSELSYFCGTSIIISLVECLLGGADPDAIKPSTRPLSGIELDMSLVIFEQLNEALKISVVKNEAEKTRISVGTPALNIPAPEDDPLDDFHAAAIGFNLEFGSVAAPVFLLAPQAILLKTRPIRRAGLKASELKAQADWKMRLGKRVAGSTVQLEARINLDAIKLSEIGRLQPGDILPFSESTGAQVMLRGNGQDIYSCALGRSGQRYIVRIEGSAGTDENWRSHFS